MSKKIPKTLQELNLVDRFLFDEAMEVPQVYETVVGILLEDEYHFLDEVHTEKEFRVSPGLRSIRLDVVSMDEYKDIYYTEMQKENTYNLPKRSRYYQGQLDVSLLPPGEVDFNRLNDTCMILVAPFDIFGKGLYRYTFEGRCLECPELSIGDGVTRIFINTKGTNREDFSKEFLDFMEYITNSTDEVAAKSDSERIHFVHKAVQAIRQAEQMGVKYMQKWEERVYDRLEGREEGRAEGHSCGTAVTLVKNVQSLMKNLNISLEEACAAVDVTAAQYQEACELAGDPGFSGNQRESHYSIV